MLRLSEAYREPRTLRMNLITEGPKEDLITEYHK